MQKMLLTICLALGGVFVIYPRHIMMETASSSADPRFGSVTYGAIPQYHDQNGLRQDLSGAAFHDGLIVTVDDGGAPSDYPFIHASYILASDQPLRIAIAADQKDLEGATWSRGYYVTTTSMSIIDQPAFSGISRFNANLAQWQFTAASRLPLRSELLAGLQQHFANETWFQRIAGQRPRDGGLNVEAISRAAADQGAETLLLGLRSPLFGKRFGNPQMDSSLSLKDGLAIVAVISEPFGDKPAITIKTLDLNGAGIRAMEWIPALNGFVVVSGPINRGNSFNLWLWPHPNGPVEQLFIPGFEQLCRPESVIQIMEKRVPYLLILSEDSGTACANTKFSSVKIKLISPVGKASSPMPPAGR